jgi:hypothetical protein
MTNTDLAPMPDRLRFALDALTKDEFRTRRSLPGRVVDAELATRQLAEYDKDVRRLCALPEHYESARAARADVYAVFAARIASPAETEAQLGDLRERIAMTRRQLRELEPTDNGMATLHRWGTGQ